MAARIAAAVHCVTIDSCSSTLLFVQLVHRVVRRGTRSLIKTYGSPSETFEQEKQNGCKEEREEVLGEERRQVIEVFEEVGCEVIEEVGFEGIVVQSFV